MHLTEDSFRALARSSPWRWRTMHFRHRDEHSEVEAWVQRPDRLLVRTPNDGDHVVTDVLGDPTFVTVGGPPPTPVARWAYDLVPALRPDGLVAVRPEEGADPIEAAEIVYGDLMWQTYRWVAMLDPVELSHHTVVSDLRETVRNDRPTWRATVEPVEGYEPRCGCCPLLWSEISQRDEYGDDWGRRPGGDPGVVCPEVYDVSLDLRTGVVVELANTGGATASYGFTLDILDVDAQDEHLPGVPSRP